MKNLLYILVSVLILSSCSKSDEDISSDNNSNITFLEKYCGTIWLKNNPDQVLYIRFINRTDTPLEYWIKDISCFNYRLERIYENNSLTINSEDILEFRYSRNIDATDYVNIITIEVFDNMILLESKHFEDDILVLLEYLNYDKSKEDVDNLPLCDSIKAAHEKWCDDLSIRCIKYLD